MVIQMKVPLMPRYYLAILLLFFVNAAHAEIIDNEKALNVIYDTKIAGVGFNSSVEDIKNAISQYEIPMDCNYTERKVVSKINSAKKNKKEIFYQTWNCKYIDGMKHKMLDVRTSNGIVMYIMYRGSILSSLDEQDMFSYYRGINKKLLATGITHDDHNFTFTDIGPDVSPKYIQQNLATTLLTACNGRASSVVFKEKLTEMPAKKTFVIEVEYKRQNCF